MALKNVLLLENLSAEAHKMLKENTRLFESDTPFTGGEIARKHPIHAIITRGKGPVDAELIGQCPALKVIARCGVGLDNIDVDSATRQGVRVLNAPGSNADTVAEHTLGLMLALQRKLCASIAAVKSNQWSYRNAYSGDEIRGRTLGILGMGEIGRRVARLAAAFGMQVVYHSSTPREDIPYPFLTFEELLTRSEILSLHLPLTPDTRDMIDRKALECMPDRALIINTARGEIIDQAALIKALENGRIAGYAADVPMKTPPDPDHPFTRLDNALITPHLASLTGRTFREMSDLTVKNVLAFLSEEPVEDKFIFNRAAF